MFDIPVVLFFMKRKQSTLQVLERIAEIKPSRIYLISDAGRNKDEHEKVIKCREAVEESINWTCEIFKDYADTNKGVYDRIGLGAKRVLQKEKWAIFLEDDNLPEISFFYFCKEMLERYELDNRIIWVCGTNYLTKYETFNQYSYVFTKHTLPCGWASWSSKFVKHYDGDLELYNNSFVKNNIKNIYNNKRLEKQKKYFIDITKKGLLTNPQKLSWDHQMTFTILANSFYGVAPTVNLIKNIGVNIESTHGGTSLTNPMTKRFCGMDSLEISFPLKHPPVVLPDIKYEEKIGDIICIPWWYYLGIKVARFIRKIFGISNDVSFSRILFDPKNLIKNYLNKKK